MPTKLAIVGLALLLGGCCSPRICTETEQRLYIDTICPDGFGVHCFYVGDMDVWEKDGCVYYDDPHVSGIGKVCGNYGLHLESHAVCVKSEPNPACQ